MPMHAYTARTRGLFAFWGSYGITSALVAVRPTDDRPAVWSRTTFCDPERATAELAREHEALVSMQGADSARIDTLADRVGTLAGHVEHVRNDVAGVRNEVSGVRSGIDRLTDSLALLMKHDVLMTEDRSRVEALRLRQDKYDDRLSRLEGPMPGLIEARTWLIRGLLATLGVVGLAVLALVLRQ